VIKGRRVFRDLAEAKAYVLQRREELRKDWEAQAARVHSQTARTTA
jgi:hypothetical protein